MTSEVCLTSDGISLNVSCASCGGAVDTLEGQRVATCPYCQTLLYIDGDRGVYTVMFRNELDNAKVMASLKQWFDKGLKARDLPQKAMVTEVYPIYIPFWRFLARAAGWVCGYREEHYTDKNGNRHTRRIPLEKMVFRDFEWSEIACDPGDIGVTRLPRRPPPPMTPGARASRPSERWPSTAPRYPTSHSRRYTCCPST